MKKFALLLLLLPTFIMVVSGAANAQRKNTTSHDVVKHIENNVDEKSMSEKKDKNCQCNCEHHKKCKKKHKKKHHKESDK